MGRAPLGRRYHDGLHDPFKVTGYVACLHSQSQETLISHPAVAPLIVPRLSSQRVEFTVDLNGQPSSGTIEIKDIRPDRVLPSKPQPRLRRPPQHRPQPQLRRGHGFAQRTRPLDRKFRRFHSSS